MKNQTAHSAKGFIGSIFVYLNLISGMLFVLFVISNFLLFGEFHPLLPFFLLACFIVDYTISPLAYTRYKVDGDGIKCGKVLIKYDEIENVSLHHGVIYSWYGFRLLEEYTGFKQHFNIHVGTILSINGSFSSFDSENAKQSLCIPLTKKVHELLKIHCPKHLKSFNEAAISDGICDQHEQMFIGRIVFSALILLLYSSGLIAAISFLSVPIIGAMICLIEAPPFLSLALFKGEISLWVQKRKLWWL